MDSSFIHSILTPYFSTESRGNPAFFSPAYPADEAAQQEGPVVRGPRLRSAGKFHRRGSEGRCFELREEQQRKEVTTSAEKNPGESCTQFEPDMSGQKQLDFKGKGPPPETTMGLCG
jgi:hypothetical protein